jgi:hypothetical protein
MRTLLTYITALSIAALTWGVQPATAAAKKKAPVKKSQAKSATKKPGATAKAGAAEKGKATVKSGSAVHTASGKKAGKRSSKKTPVKSATWRNRQAAPSPERYREIQDALVAKGYLSADEATGEWNQASAAALKRFQQEQNIDSNGKINSLSLIALGLGPKHEIGSTKPAEGGNTPTDPNGR